MKLFKLLISSFFILSLYTTVMAEENCDKFDKLSKEYAKCTSENLKDKTSKKASEWKNKFNSSKLKEKLIKFKNSKSHSEFIEKK